MKKLYVIRIIIIISLSLYILGCDDIAGEIIDDFTFLNSLYDNSMDTLKIEEGHIVLEPHLSINYMPGVLPKKRKLVASLYLVNLDSMPISNEIHMSQLFVINNEKIWKSTPTRDDQVYLPEYKIYGASTDGPEWETDIYVDVIIEIKNELTNNSYFLIARDQIITRDE